MKENNHATMSAFAIVAGLVASSASAVSLNPKGIGQVLVYPYYTVNKHQDTLISVANTTDVGKVVNVEFLEGINSRDILFSESSCRRMMYGPHRSRRSRTTAARNCGPTIAVASTFFLPCRRRFRPARTMAQARFLPTADHKESRGRARAMSR